MSEEGWGRAGRVLAAGYTQRAALVHAGRTAGFSPSRPPPTPVRCTRACADASPASGGPHRSSGSFHIGCTSAARARSSRPTHTQRPSRLALAGRCRRRGQVGFSGRCSLRTQRYGMCVFASRCPRVPRRSPPRPGSRGRWPYIALKRRRTARQPVGHPVDVLAHRRAVADSAAAAALQKQPPQTRFAVRAVRAVAGEPQRTPGPRASALVGLPRRAGR